MNMPPLNRPRALPSRSWGPFRQEWYSICSMHSVHDSLCSNCNIGSWINVYRQAISADVYRVAPWAWRWIAKQVGHL